MKHLIFLSEYKKQLEFNACINQSLSTCVSSNNNEKKKDDQINRIENGCGNRWDCLIDRSIYQLLEMSKTK